MACAAIAADPELELVAAVAHRRAGGTVEGIEVADDPAAMLAAGVQVAVDFTVLEAARVNVPWCGEQGLHAVVGTTGFTDDDVAALRSAFTRSSCLVAPNFAIGAVLMMRFAELAAPYFETAEVIELHHDAKADAPSGTAMMTVQRMAAASPTGRRTRPATRSSRAPAAGPGPAGIHVHSVRLRGLVAHQEVLLGTTGQTLTIRHDSYDRASFMPGRAARRSSGSPSAPASRSGSTPSSGSDASSPSAAALRLAPTRFARQCVRRRCGALGSALARRTRTGVRSSPSAADGGGAEAAGQLLLDALHAVAADDLVGRRAGPSGPRRCRRRRRRTARARGWRRRGWRRCSPSIPA